MTIDMIRKKINELVGKDINMQVCRGRKQIERYSGVVENTFPSVFVVRLTNENRIVNQLSYSYSDVLCGEVTIKEAGAD